MNLNLDVDISKSNRRHYIGFINHIVVMRQLVLEQNVRHISIRYLEQLSQTYIAACILTKRVPFYGFLFTVKLGGQCGYFVRVWIQSFLFCLFSPKHCSHWLLQVCSLLQTFGALRIPDEAMSKKILGRNQSKSKCVQIQPMSCCDLSIFYKSLRYIPQIPLN